MFTQKHELIQWAAIRANFTQAAMRRALDAIVSVIVDKVSVGESVRINNFGTFYRESRAARTGRNPKTGAAVPIPARHRPSFKAGKEFFEITQEMARDHEHD